MSTQYTGISERWSDEGNEYWSAVNKEPDGGMFGDPAELFQIEAPEEGC